MDLPSQSFAAFTILAMSPKLIKRLNSFCRAGLHVWQTPLAVRPVSWCPWFLVKTLNCPELPTLLTKIGRHPAAWRGKLLYTGWWCQSKHPKTQICLRIPQKHIQYHLSPLVDSPNGEFSIGKIDVTWGQTRYITQKNIQYQSQILVSSSWLFGMNIMIIETTNLSSCPHGLSPTRASRTALRGCTKDTCRCRKTQSALVDDERYQYILGHIDTEWKDRITHTIYFCIKHQHLYKIVCYTYMYKYTHGIEIRPFWDSCPYKPIFH